MSGFYLTAKAVPQVLHSSPLETGLAFRVFARMKFSLTVPVFPEQGQSIMPGGEPLNFNHRNPEKTSGKNIYAMPSWKRIPSSISGIGLQKPKQTSPEELSDQIPRYQPWSLESPLKSYLKGQGDLVASILLSPTSHTVTLGPSK